MDALGEREGAAVVAAEETPHLLLEYLRPVWHHVGVHWQFTTKAPLYFECLQYNGRVGKNSVFPGSHNFRHRCNRELEFFLFERYWSLPVLRIGKLQKSSLFFSSRYIYSRVTLKN